MNLTINIGLKNDCKMDNMNYKLINIGGEIDNNIYDIR